MAQEVIDRLPEAAPPSRMTFEEWLALDGDEGPLTEWVDGEVIVFEMPTELHQALAMFLARLFGDFLEIHPIGRAYFAPLPMRLRSRPSGREPDILFVRTEHLDRFVGGYLGGPADLVVEIVSDDSVTRDARDKRAEYAAAGIPEYWILDPRPLRRRAFFLQLDADGVYQEVPLDADGRYHSAVLPGLWLDPDWFWQDPLPRMSYLRGLIFGG